MEQQRTSPKKRDAAMVFSKWQRVPGVLFCGAFGFAFAVSLIRHSARDGLTAVWMVFFAAILLLMGSFARRFIGFLTRYLHRICFVFIGFLLMITIYLGFILRYEPRYDLGAIYHGAVSWVQNGTFARAVHDTVPETYFYQFPNNLGGLTLLFMVFKPLSLLGVTDFYPAALCLGSLCVGSALWFSLKIVRKIYGKNAVFLALLLFMFYLPLYTMGAVFYTDTLSLPFPTLIVYLFLRLPETVRRRDFWVTALPMSLWAALGVMVKTTVVIAVIAVVLYSWKSPKKASILAVCFAFVMFAAQFLSSAYFRVYHLTNEELRDRQVPYLHWVVMSLQNEGRYNGADYARTLAIDDPGERREVLARLGAERLQNLGIVGAARLAAAKTAVIFGGGGLGQSDFLDDNPRRMSRLHQWLLKDGTHHNLYAGACSGLLLLSLLLTLPPVIMGLSGRRKMPNLLPQLCLLGIFAFLLLWETSERYIVNYMPFVMISASALWDSSYQTA